MKAEDLMIGDWVQIPSELNRYKILKSTFDMDEAVLYEPIPLTPEILEKIGFTTEPNIGYIIDDWDGNQIIYDSWNHVLRIIKDYKTCLDIETFNDLTVHELQHALKLCGINKEIAL